MLFKGKYYKGKKWIGKFNEYEQNKIFEGEIKEGKKWKGKEIEYNSNYDIIYEAYIIKGERYIIKSKRNNNCSIY